MRITAKCVADCFGVGAMLDCKRENDCRVARVSVCLRVCFVVRQKQFGNCAIDESAYSGDVTQAANLDFKSLSWASIWQALTRGHSVLAGCAVERVVLLGWV